MPSEAGSIGSQISKRVYKHEGEPVLTTLLRRPVCVGEQAAQRRMEDYYARLAKACRKRWEDTLHPCAAERLLSLRAQSKPFSVWEANLDFHITFQDETMVSLYCDISETRGDRRPLVQRSAVTWDLASGTPRTLQSLLPGYTRKKLLAAVAAQARERLASGESLLDANCTEGLAAAFSPDRFYLTEQGVTLFFPMDTLGPFAEGIPAFPLPLQAAI